MFHRTALHTLLFITWAVVLLVEENHRLTCKGRTIEPLTEDKEEDQDEAKHPLNDKPDKQNLNSSIISEYASSLVEKQKSLKKMLNNIFLADANCLSEEEVEELKDLKLEFTERNKEMKKMLQDLKQQQLEFESAAEDKEKEGASQEVETKLQPKQNVYGLNESAIDHILMMEKKAINAICAVKNAALRKLNRKIKKVYKTLLDTLTTAVDMVTTCDGTPGSTPEGVWCNKEVLLCTESPAAIPRPKTYKLYEDHVTQAEAIDACEIEGGRLAVPMDKGEDNQILLLVHNRTSTYRRYWIAVDDIKEEGKWTNSHTGQPVNYMNFDVRSGQPDNHHNNEHCATVESCSHAWNDLPCDDGKTGYVCQFIKV